MSTKLARRPTSLILAALVAACAPAAPSIQGNPPPPLPAPVVTAIQPAIGSADGGTAILIDGANFAPRAIVRFGGVANPGTVTFSNGRLYLVAPPHAPGMVDIEVQVGDQRGVLAGAYTYAAPDTLDFSGSWLGWIGESEFTLKFTVEGGLVTAVSCGGVSLELPTPLPVTNGQFSYTGSGVGITGRIVSPGQSRGTVTMPSCIDPFTNEWWASR